MSSNAEVVTAKNKRLAVMPKIKSFMGLFAYTLIIKPTSTVVNT
jgi:hypothetical protein